MQTVSKYLDLISSIMLRHHESIRWLSLLVPCSALVLHKALTSYVVHLYLLLTSVLLLKRKTMNLFHHFKVFSKYLAEYIAHICNSSSVDLKNYNTKSISECKGSVACTWRGSWIAPKKAFTHPPTPLTLVVWVSVPNNGFVMPDCCPISQLPSFWGAKKSLDYSWGTDAI